MEKKCCICGNTFNGYGNNAAPIKNGTCCNKCNTQFVVPSRLYGTRKFITYTVCPTERVFNTNSELLTSHGFVFTGIYSMMSYFYNETTEETVVLIPAYIIQGE